MSEAHATSAGHALSGSDWLDVHFEAARPEYEDGLRWVGVEPGWRVLDAGCGGGSFLPLLRAQAGPEGAVVALDLAPENVARVEARAQPEPGLAGLHANLGSVLDLPFDDATFDCVWSANVTQYLTDVELPRMLAEFCRVLKPGGVMALKDFDASLIGLFPIDDGMLSRWLAARRADYATRSMSGTFCGASLPSRLRKLGLHDVRARSFLVERRAPLPNVARELMRRAFGFFGPGATSLRLPAGDVEAWRKLGEDPSGLIDDPDFCWREGFVVAVGRVPA